MTNRLLAKSRTVTRCKESLVLCLVLCTMELGLSWSALGAENSGVPQPIPPQPEFTVQDLGTFHLGSPGIRTAIGINSSGQVIGDAETADGAVHAFRTAPNAAINPTTDDLGSLGGSSSHAVGINSSGQVAGWDCCVRGLAAFRTAPNAAINPTTDELGVPFPFFCNAFAGGINDLGQVTGYCMTSNNPAGDDAWRTDPNGNVLIGISGGARASGINNSGQVVGVFLMQSSEFNRFHAFRTAPNAVINSATDDLGALYGAPSLGFSSATGINNSGQVVGSSYTASGVLHAFRTAPNATINPATDDLGTLGGDSSSAAGINSSGQVVGYSFIANGVQHAFLYSVGVMSDLNSLIPTNSGWTLYQANAINDLGQIVAYGLINGEPHAIRLDPTPAGYLSLLQDTIESFDLSPGISMGLNSILLAALNALQKGNINAAQNQRGAFENAVNALRHTQLTDAQADTLLNLASLAI